MPGNRTFWVFRPLSVSEFVNPEAPLLPAIFLFHGTDQRALWSGLWAQRPGPFEESEPKRSGFQELAFSQKVILVFCEAVVDVADWNPQRRICVWKPGGSDVQFTDDAAKFVTAKYRADPKRMYAVGHSNGGLFTSDLALKGTTQWSAIVNHMGGLDGGEKGELEEAFAAADGKRKAPLLIVTAKGDDNRRPCLFAFEQFKSHGWPVDLTDLPGRHFFASETVSIIWAFLSKHRL